MSSIGGLPPKPTPPGANASEQDRLRYQEQSQAYWFAVNQAQNMINQEGMQKSNMQKAAHDALMEIARNLK
jgi:hypothetical protein